jgi:SAM-dependent methyltransferase
MTGVNICRTNSGIRINVGCGLSPTPGWLNFDNSLTVRSARWPGVATALARLRLASPRAAELIALARDGHVRFANATTRLPCAAGTVSAVYSSHMIEHLDRTEARSFLTEVGRVLEPGGVVRLAVPDLSLMVADYVATGDADNFVRSTYLGLDRPAGLRGWARWALVGPRHHLWMYDGASLTGLLLDAGFTAAAVMPPGTTRISDPGRLDLRERSSESVYVEATRPL